MRAGGHCLQCPTCIGSEDQRQKRQHQIFFEISRMAPIGVKLWENAYQTIPNISFFDAENIFLANFFDENLRHKKIRRKIDKLPVFAELWIFGRNRQMRLEKLPPKFEFSTLYDFWRRGKRDSFNFFPTFGQKRLQPFSFFG